MMGLAYQFLSNRRGLEHGMVLGETGLLQMRQEKGQAVGPFWVALGCFMIDAVKMAINSHDHSA